jgi:hypothetical protein
MLYKFAYIFVNLIFWKIRYLEILLIITILCEHINFMKSVLWEFLSIIWISFNCYLLSNQRGTCIHATFLLLIITILCGWKGNIYGALYSCLGLLKNGLSLKFIPFVFHLRQSNKKIPWKVMFLY